MNYAGILKVLNEMAILLIKIKEIISTENWKYICLIEKTRVFIKQDISKQVSYIRLMDFNILLMNPL